LMSFRDRALASLAKRTSILKEVETELQRVNSTAAIMRNAQEGDISMQPLQSIMAKMDDVDVTEKKNVSAFNLYCKATPKGT
jgi:succinate dehydrogenase/fumarate reductase flavoprotein subunit